VLATPCRHGMSWAIGKSGLRIPSVEVLMECPLVGFLIRVEVVSGRGGSYLNFIGKWRKELAGSSGQLIA
jgi:hypothetical protein